MFTAVRTVFFLDGIKPVEEWYVIADFFSLFFFVVVVTTSSHLVFWNLS